MRLHFTQLDISLDITGEHVSVLQIANRTLFSKITYSLIMHPHKEDLEPLLLFEEEKEVSLKDGLFLVSDPIALPLKSRQIETRMHALFEGLFYEDETLRSEVEEFNQKIENQLQALGLQLNADYSFKLEWDTKKYLKAFDFGIENESTTLLDNLIVFLKIFSDLFPDKGLVFINLKSYFEKRELENLYFEIVSLNLPALFLESVHDERVFERESKTIIDQHFLEE